VTICKGIAFAVTSSALILCEMQRRLCQNKNTGHSMANAPPMRFICVMSYAVAVDQSEISGELLELFVAL
jgi:hypothetical protein